MAQKHVDATASRKVELAVGELASLAVPPCVAVQYLGTLAQGRLSPASLADLTEAEPALAAATLSLAQRLGSGPPSQRHAVRLVLDRLDADDLRDALLRMKVTAAFEIEFADEQPARPARTDLILHSLAVACAARRLAETAGADPHMAYSAGLLHDLGKLALQDVMPKSLSAIAAEAKAAGESLYQIETKHLGTNHALLGKQLAQRWRLPEPIRLAIWLHHRDAAAFSEAIPEARVALLVKVADAIARAAGVGESGSFDEPEPLKELAEVVEMPVRTLQQVRDALPDEVGRKSRTLAFDLPHAAARYCELIQTVAADLSERCTKQAVEDRSLQADSGYLTFAQQFLQGLDPAAAAVESAEDLARRWQRFFQTGAVCLVLTAGAREDAIDVAVAESLGHSFRTVAEGPADGALVPRPLANGFAIVEARDHVDWLFDQLDVDLDRNRTRMLPLLTGGQTVGLIAFELNYPADATRFAEKFEMAASMAGAVLGLALARERQEHLAERLAQADQKPARRTEAKPVVNAVEALAEMAAGVAHELNNPLSVIVGRAQLLAQAEEDGQKRYVLNLIGENGREASGVVDDLMSYAEPAEPRKDSAEIGGIIQDAIDLAAQKTGAEHVNAQVEISPDAPEIYVDPAQIATALSGIIANAIESYEDPTGPVKITAEPGDDGLTLRIADLGRGMDPATRRKAPAPFYSAKPAGRRRGMGLAYATRLIRLNAGTLAIESQPAKGTTVTITLPYE